MITIKAIPINALPGVKILLLLALFLAWLPSLPAQTASPGTASVITGKEIIAEGEKMADAQLAQLANAPDQIDWGAHKNQTTLVQPQENPLQIGWVPAVMWAGLSDFSHVSSKPAYKKALVEMGQKSHWQPLLRSNSPHHADDLCIGQSFLDLYEADHDPSMLVSIQNRVESASDFILQSEEENPENSPKNTLSWWWCDALFMAPPAYAHLYQITRNPKVLQAMNKEWSRTEALLYDHNEHLFYRDKRFLDKKTKNGKKVFWARGNGWVFAGLARMLQHLPQDDPARAQYVSIFKAMAAKLQTLQQSDGTWPPSLLDPEEFPYSETSGTALDCFAFAWGIRNGLLDSKTYLTTATRAWAALLAARRPDGLLGYVQGVGDSPGLVHAGDTRLYATGAFLMAASELSKLAPLTILPPPSLHAL